MRTLEIRPRRDQRISCVACARHMRPETVPWMQHSIGCPVRMAELTRFPQVGGPRSSGAAAASAGPR